MQTQAIEVDRSEASLMWRKYQTHRHYQTPMDAEIERVYRTIAKGKTVIKALESITTVGLDGRGMPKLAIVRADATHCWCTMRSDGSARMSTDPWIDGRSARSRFFDFPAAAFAGSRHQAGKAMAPHIPPDIRPHRGLQNYHILFEAEWSPVPPIDPLLLRRIGIGDMWLVVGAWELTSVERAAMSSRL
jgi:hypothetical protein